MSTRIDIRTPAPPAPWPPITDATADRLQALREALTQQARSLGFDALGVTDVDLSDHHDGVRTWLAKGFQGAMGYLERNLEKRLHPDQLVPGTVRVICVRMNYAPTDDTPLDTLEAPEQGYIARYALGRDYHKVVRRRLAQLGAWLNEAAAELDPQYRAFTDSAPVLERPLAAKAGLGWIGKHTLLLNQQAGSWFFLGELFTNLPLAVDVPTETSHCGACKACMTVCPTQAIVAPGVLDAQRCISYLTIENKGPIPVALRNAIGNRIFGCDDCQLYCPWNRDAPSATEPDFRPRHRASTPDSAPLDLRKPSLLALFALDQPGFEKLTEGSAMRRISYVQWQRNLAVALGNGAATPDALAALRHRKRTLEAETSRQAEPGAALLLEHIDWALDQLAARSDSAPES